MSEHLGSIPGRYEKFVVPDKGQTVHRTEYGEARLEIARFMGSDANMIQISIIQSDGLNLHIQFNASQSMALAGTIIDVMRNEIHGCYVEGSWRDSYYRLMDKHSNHEMDLEKAESMIAQLQKKEKELEEKILQLEFGEQ